MSARVLIIIFAVAAILVWTIYDMQRWWCAECWRGWAIWPGDRCHRCWKARRRGAR